MAVINFGSINIDYTYRTSHLVLAGETLTSSARLQGLGGKGMNQSIALHRAGVPVVHVGCIESDDEWTKNQMLQSGVDLRGISELSEPTGHAIIEVSDQGDNRIILYPGANHQLTSQQIQEALLANEDCGFVLTQNETNKVDEILTTSKNAGKTVVFNPAPCDVNAAKLPLDHVDFLVVNEVELMQLAADESIESAIIKLQENLPHIKLVVTLGADGVRYIDADISLHVPAKKVDKVVDTTAAGDTFIGYFMAGLTQSLGVEKSLEWGVSASAITVTTLGASSSIPWRKDLTLS
jgi:ribokinase